ncbi:Hypothetical predicted protein [Podarcis lilfordi]|uniref:Uncharacterized protein n=1 Tax=Podarcis lilfordi TaxID=74358 RepID=A0AA35PHF0_9SAUR|nr:Hypothetical predicted protein [Podarcis lilfordi]
MGDEGQAEAQRRSAAALNPIKLMGRSIIRQRRAARALPVGASAPSRLRFARGKSSRPLAPQGRLPKGLHRRSLRWGRRYGDGGVGSFSTIPVDAPLRAA